MSLLHIMAFPVAPNVNRKNIVENLLFSLIILLHILKHVYISMELQKSILITARKRSLGQGNIFTSVCHSVYGVWGGGMHGGGHAWQGGGCAWQGGMHGGGVHGRGHVWQGAYMAGGACVAGEGEHACQGGMHWRSMHMHGMGACMAGRHAWQGACMAGETAIAAGGVHPTEMHSCSKLLLPANEVWGKVIFSQVCVKNSVHRGGVSAPRGVPGWGVSAPGGSALGGGARWRPSQRLLLRAVRILLECILVYTYCRGSCTSSGKETLIVSKSGFLVQKRVV